MGGKNLDEEKLESALPEETGAPEETPREPAERDRRDREIRQFLREFPEVRPEEIGREVWEGVRQGDSLSGSYRRWQARQLREENLRLRARLAADETNRDNRRRSVGSQRSSGRCGGRDAFLEAFLDGDG